MERVKLPEAGPGSVPHHRATVFASALEAASWDWLHVPWGAGEASLSHPRESHQPGSRGAGRAVSIHPWLPTPWCGPRAASWVPASQPVAD